MISTNGVAGLCVSVFVAFALYLPVRQVGVARGLKLASVRLWAVAEGIEAFRRRYREICRDGKTYVGGNSRVGVAWSEAGTADGVAAVMRGRVEIA